MILQLTEEDINNPEVLGEKLIQLAEIVVRKHFYASLKDKDDLVSVGVLKALNLINANSWTKQRGSFVNYIYSGMRNEMHNYLYHQNKFSIVDTDSLLKEDGREDSYFEMDGCTINYGLIHSICIKFMDSFGEGIEKLVVDEMKQMGYHIEGMGDCSHTLVCCNSILKEQYDESVEQDAIGRIIGLILWKKKEREQ
jgi:hypothetical protein